MSESEKGVKCGSLVKISRLFIGEKSVRNPNFIGNFGSDIKVLYAWDGLKRQSRILPSLTKVKVSRKIHINFGNATYADQKHGDGNIDRSPSVVGSDTLVISVFRSKECIEGFSDERTRITNDENGVTDK